MKALNNFFYYATLLLCASLFIFILVVHFNISNVEKPERVLGFYPKDNTVKQLSLNNSPIITSEGSELFIKEAVAIIFNNNPKLLMHQIESNGNDWKLIKKYFLKESIENFEYSIKNFLSDEINNGVELMKIVIPTQIFKIGEAKTVSGEKLYRYAFKVQFTYVGIGGRKIIERRATMVLKETNQYNYQGLAIEMFSFI